MWRSEEDQALRDLVARFGQSRWSMVASEMNSQFGLSGKNSKQCYERWNNFLKPNLDLNKPWTEEEDKILNDAHDSWGNRWAEIAKLLPGRSANTVKNRWFSQRRKEVRAIRRIANRTSHSGSTTSEEDELEGSDTKPALTASGNKKRKADGLADLIRYVSAAEEAAQEIMIEKKGFTEDIVGGGSSAASLIKSPRDSVLFSEKVKQKLDIMDREAQSGVRSCHGLHVNTSTSVTNYTPSPSDSLSRDMLKRMLGQDAGYQPTLGSPLPSGSTPWTPSVLAMNSSGSHHHQHASHEHIRSRCGSSSSSRSEQSIQYLNLVMDLQQRTRTVLKNLADTHSDLVDEIKKVNKRNLESLNVIGGIAIAKDSKYNEIVTNALQSVLQTDDTATRVSKINFSIYGVNAMGEGELVSPLQLEVEGTQGGGW